MSKTYADAISATAAALTVTAFDRFRLAARAADLPLGIVNALADYKSAVDFALRATDAQSAGMPEEAMKLLGWSHAKLSDMATELRSLAGNH